MSEVARDDLHNLELGLMHVLVREALLEEEALTFYQVELLRRVDRELELSK